MISLIKHTLRVAHSLVREHAKAIARSSKWSGVRKAAIKANPNCAACGDTQLLQVHHFVPFEKDTALELEPKNLVVMCMGKNECHLLIAHGDNFRHYNPQLAADLLNIKSGILTLEAAKLLAKKNAVAIKG